jgi:hypothetical protein
MKTSFRLAVGHAVVCRAQPTSVIACRGQVASVLIGVRLQEWYILSSGLSRLQWLPNTPFSFHPVCSRNHAVSPYKYISIGLFLLFPIFSMTENWNLVFGFVKFLSTYNSQIVMEAGTLCRKFELKLFGDWMKNCEMKCFICRKIDSTFQIKSKINSVPTNFGIFQLFT